MPTGEQISVFLLNRPGQLERVCELLAREKINIRAISVVDSVDHGVLRLMVSDTEKAKGIFTSKSLPWVSTKVLMVPLANVPGAFEEVTRKLAAAGINVEYTYGSACDGAGTSLAVFRVSDLAKAARAVED